MTRKIFSLIILLTSIISCKKISKQNSDNLKEKPNKNLVNDENKAKKSNEINKSKKLLKLKDLIIGSWKRNDDPLYTLVFNKKNNDEIECVFYNGGPFEEYLTYRVSKDNKIDLYFDFIAGSISFNKFNKPGNEDYCKIKVVSCLLTDKNQLLIDTYEDKCGQIIKENSVKLTRVTE